MTSINKKILLFFLAIAISKMQLVNAMQQNIIYSHVQRPYVDQTGTLNVPTHVNEIFDEDFIGDLSLCNINIPSNVQRIGFGSFSHCYNVTSINIDNGLREISSYAFTGLFKVRNLVIPESVTKIGRNALHMLNLDYFYVLNQDCVIEQQDYLTMRETNVQLVDQTHNNMIQNVSLGTPVRQYIIQALYTVNDMQVQQQMNTYNQSYNVDPEPMQTQQQMNTYNQSYNVDPEPMQVQQQMNTYNQSYNVDPEPMQTQQYTTPMSDINANQMQQFCNV